MAHLGQYAVGVETQPEARPVSLPGHADYKMVEQMHGFAFYVVEHEGKPALVKNPHYEFVGTVDAGGLDVIG